MIIAIQADSLETLAPQTDTTLFISSELRLAGYKTFFYTPEQLYVENGHVYAKGRFAQIYYQDFISKIEVIGEFKTICLSLDVAVVIIRQDPPMNMEYITSLLILELLPKHILILNDPLGIRSCAEKITPMHFSHISPPTILVSSISDAVINFCEKHRKLILKPLYWFGGKYVEVLDGFDEALISKALKDHDSIILQKFFPQIKDGDKRIFIINNKPEIALKRVPAHGQYKANLASGGTAMQTDITEQELKICLELCPYLQENGIFMAGIDVIDGKLIEVNVTSPTGFVAIDRLYNVNLARLVVDHIDYKLAICAK